MSRYSPTILEEELKNKVAADWFAAYDTTQIVGRIDFSVAYPRPTDPQLFDVETQFLLWAEAKRGTHKDIKASLVQLVLTIGQARTFDTHLPPLFLGAFDAEKIAFLPYHTMLDTFCATDFDWTVTPSNHETREFRQLYAAIDKILSENTYTYNFETEEKELRQFIRTNFRDGSTGDVSRIRINKTNFTAVYRRWLAAVRPTIDVDWEQTKRGGILDGHFFLADLLATNDNVTIKQKLFVVLASDHYVLARRRNDMGFLVSMRADFTDGGRAHRNFWRKYQRPPRQEYQDYIAERVDLLVPQDVRERKGSYFTPQQWVELSQQYIADELGDDWQDEYYVWDCCAGTGNLLVGLTNKHRIYASTLDQADVDIMHERIQSGANLLDRHVFQFDFLNDPLLDDPEHGVKSKLPEKLQAIIRDPEERRRLVIYINPPYAEAGNKKQRKGTGVNKTKTATDNKIYLRYKKTKWASNELFAQFFARIYNEIPTCLLAEFSKLKILQGTNFENFRSVFRAKLGRFFIVPADTFDNVKGDFPIGFFIWNLGEQADYSTTKCDVYNADGTYRGKKTIYGNVAQSQTIHRWMSTFKDNTTPVIGGMNSGNNDFQDQNSIYIVSKLEGGSHNFRINITHKNLHACCVFFAVRKVIPATWLNDRDQFLYPNEGWAQDYEFQTDSLVYTLFNNNIQSRYGANHWIPFTEQEVGAQEAFASHFMTDYLAGKVKSAGGVGASSMPTLFDASGVSWDGGLQTADEQQASKPNGGLETAAGAYVASEHFSTEARAVMDAGRELWRYYHQQPSANPDASFYDIRLHFQGTKTTASGREQMCPDSADEHYTQLVTTLRQCLKQLAARIAPRVYDYGFLK